MKITNIDHFVLVTDDLQKCVEFYEGILGLEHVCEGGKHSLRFGSSKINIHTRAGEFAPFCGASLRGLGGLLPHLRRSKCAVAQNGAGKQRGSNRAWRRASNGRARCYAKYLSARSRWQSRRARRI